MNTMDNKIEQNWDNASWEGSRRAMIRKSLKLTVRERLQALEDLAETSHKLANLKTSDNKNLQHK